MTEREKLAFARVRDCVAEIGSMTPRNPADFEAHFRNMRVAVPAAKQLVRAMDAVGFGQLEAADRHLSEAETLLMRGTPQENRQEGAE